MREPGKELSVVRLVAGGEGLGFIDGKAVFVPGVLPGERVIVRTVKRRRDFERAELVEVLEPSPHRVRPACALAGTCGGCDWLHIDYEEQLRQKVSIVTESLRRTGRIDRDPPEIEPSEPTRARNRTQVHRGADGRLGYMTAASNDVVPVATCPAVAGPLDGIFSGAVRVPGDIDRFTAFSDGSWVAVEGIDDTRDLTVTVNGRGIFFSVGCFFQSNLGMLEKLVPWALRGLSGSVAADLYCGVGLFAAFLADSFPRVICVESSATSVAYARRNVKGEGNEFYPMGVEHWIASGGAPPGRAALTSEHDQAPPGRATFPFVPDRAPRALDAVVVDPPRAGLGPEVRAWLRATRPRDLVYVSCNPVTLARDLEELVNGGFTLEDLRLFDFYPQTSHVESVARLKSVPPRVAGNAPLRVAGRSA